MRAHASVVALLTFSTVAICCLAFPTATTTTNKLPATAATATSGHTTRNVRIRTSSSSSSNDDNNDEQYFNVQVNEFFKRPVPSFIKDAVAVRTESTPLKQDFSFVDIVTSPPTDPGVPRPLWSVILASIPTGLLWYGLGYKFATEEELLHMELTSDNNKTPRGFGGYGTLGPFSYGIILGPIAAILHLPGGINWTIAGIVFIYYTQFLLYDRVNALYEEQGWDKPLTVWWCWPIFFPFNLIVGLRQVHFLSQYFYRKRGVDEPPADPVADFFPFIKAPNFTWQDFLTTPSLWCALLSNVNDVDRSALPEPIQDFLEIGETRDETTSSSKTK